MIFSWYWKCHLWLFTLRSTQSINPLSTTNSKHFCFFFYSWSLAVSTLKPKTATGIVSTSAVTSVIWILAVFCTWLVMATLTVCSATTVCTQGSALNAVGSSMLTHRGSNTKATSGTRLTRASSVACAGDRWLANSFSATPGRIRSSAPPNVPGVTEAAWYLPRPSLVLSPWFSFYSWTMLGFRSRDISLWKTDEGIQDSSEVKS